MSQADGITEGWATLPLPRLRPCPGRPQEVGGNRQEWNPTLAPSQVSLLPRAAVAPWSSVGQPTELPAPISQDTGHALTVDLVDVPDEEGEGHKRSLSFLASYWACLVCLKGTPRSPFVSTQLPSQWALHAGVPCSP